jgi:diketogulonate reductase-like aldo/keto reductase
LNCIHGIKEKHNWNLAINMELQLRDGVLSQKVPLISNNLGHILKDETLEAIAATYKKNIAQLCVRWALQRNFITIPKSISKERIISNVDVFDFEISTEDMEKINSMDKGYLSGSEHWEHDKIE